MAVELGKEYIVPNFSQQSSVFMVNLQLSINENNPPSESLEKLLSRPSSQVQPKPSDS